MFGYLKIEITDIDNSYYPNLATFHFIDSTGKVITVTEKLDILTSFDDLSVPISGFFVKCKIFKESSEDYLIDISNPFGILSENNESIFYVCKDMISMNHFDELCDQKKDNL